MCDICCHSPHSPGCPNAPDPAPALTCHLCQEGILNGDKFLDTLEGPVCMGCLEDMTLEEILEVVGESLSVAEGGY